MPETCGKYNTSLNTVKEQEVTSSSNFVFVLNIFVCRALYDEYGTKPGLTILHGPNANLCSFFQVSVTHQKISPGEVKLSELSLIFFIFH